MAGKKYSVLKATMLIALIITLNLIGISYGFWQDSLISELRANTGYIELSFKHKPKIESEGFSRLRAKLDNGKNSRVIEISGRIESNATAEFQLDYIVENNGSLPVKFDERKFQDAIWEIQGFTLVGEPEGRDIQPEDNSSDSMTILVNASELDYTPADYTGSDASSLNGAKEDTYTVLGEFDFDIVLPYYFSSWADELTIIGNIEVIQSPVTTMMLVPVPEMDLIPIQDGIVPEDNQAQVEAEEPETAEGDDEGESSNDQGQTDGDDTTVEADEPETAEGDDEEEGSDDQGQTDTNEIKN